MSKRRRRKSWRSRLAAARMGAWVLGTFTLTGVLWVWFSTGQLTNGLSSTGLPPEALTGLPSPRWPAAAPALVSAGSDAQAALAAPQGAGLVRPTSPTSPPEPPMPSGELKVSEPVPLQRAARANNRVLPPDELSAASAAEALRTAGLTQDRNGLLQVGGAPVGEMEIGLRFYPGARADAADTARVRDPGGGETVATSLLSQDGVEKVLGFYRVQMRTLSGARFSESSAAPGQWMLQSVEPASGAQRSAMIWQDGPDVRITLSRWMAPPSAKRGG